MSTLEYTVSMLEAIPEEKLKEVQRYIQYIMFRDTENPITELLTEDAIVEQLTASMEKSDMGATIPASIVSQKMKEKYVI
ncbi:MAG: hypothetical protein NC432_09590 [Roseburia sp.]|nr:hypothetical protein [Roseburia sp.]MCM1098229.1 hypothetical protein [Ruminococcus flavefaciens]